MTTLDPSEIKVSSTFNLPVLTKQQLAELKYRTGKDMGEIISDLVADEHARLAQKAPAAPAARPTPSNRPSPIVLGA